MLSRNWVPCRRTLPASTVATFNRRPASRTSTDCRVSISEAALREATRSPETRASAPVTSSVMPSAKYASAVSPAALTRGSTATDFGATASDVCAVVRAPASSPRLTTTPHTAAAASATVTPANSPAVRRWRAVGRNMPGVGVLAASIPARTAAAVAGRSTGCFSRRRATSALIAGGTSPRRVANGSGDSVRCATRSACGGRPANGCAPVSSSYAMSPSE